ncbi:MAG: peptidylprolyl isomerase [Steroidobacteraceae bacterium]
MPETPEIKVNDVFLDASDWPTPQLAAVHELLRQRAVELDLLAAGEADEDTLDAAIETLLQKDVEVPEPTAEECRRWYDTHLGQYRSGELVHARHILFQITPGMRVQAVRGVAEAMLLELRTHPERFEERARAKSNCPSAAQGGRLGQIVRGSMIAEFEKAVFDDARVGVIPELIHTRHGFHIVSVDERVAGEQLPFEAVAGKVAGELRRACEERAVRQYITLLAGQAALEGVELEAAGSPLVR